MGIAPDRYDEIRREWIHNHLWRFEFQRVRMENLDILIRRRISVEVLNAPSRRDDLPRNPLPARGHHSVIGYLEWAGFWMMMLFIPLGWAAGKLMYRGLVQLVPGVLRSYPVVAPLWIANGVGVFIPLLFDPAPGLGSMVFWPWVAAQFASAWLVAGVYGIAEGWLGVPGSLQVWPHKLPPLQMNAVDAAEVLGADDITAPPLIDPAPAPDPTAMTVPMRSEPRR